MALSANALQSKFYKFQPDAGEMEDILGDDNVGLAALHTYIFPGVYVGRAEHKRVVMEEAVAQAEEAYKQDGWNPGEDSMAVDKMRDVHHAAAPLTLGIRGTFGSRLNVPTLEVLRRGSQERESPWGPDADSGRREAARPRGHAPSSSSSWDLNPREPHSSSSSAVAPVPADDMLKPMKGFNWFAPGRGLGAGRPKEGAPAAASAAQAVAPNARAFAAATPEGVGQRRRKGGTAPRPDAAAVDQAVGEDRGGAAPQLATAVVDPAVGVYRALYALESAEVAGEARSDLGAPAIAASQEACALAACEKVGCPAPATFEADAEAGQRLTGEAEAAKYKQVDSQEREEAPSTKVKRRPHKADAGSQGAGPSRGERSGGAPPGSRYDPSDFDPLVQELRCVYQQDTGAAAAEAPAGRDDIWRRGRGPVAAADVCEQEPAFDRKTYDVYRDLYAKDARQAAAAALFRPGRSEARPRTKPQSRGDERPTAPAPTRPARLATDAFRKKEKEMEAIAALYACDGF